MTDEARRASGTTVMSCARRVYSHTPSLVHGIYGSVASLLPGARIEPYVFLRDNHTAGFHSCTGGIRVAGVAKQVWNYELDFLRQKGDTGSQTLSAWGTTLQVQREVRSLPWHAALLGEFNYASGDRNPSDGVSNTLDQLHPTNHGPNTRGRDFYAAWIDFRL